MERLSAALLLWVPPLVLLIWGLIYLIDAAQLLLAPGVGLRYKYPAEGGTYTLETDSYAIFPWDSRAAITGAQLKNPKGEIEARVERIQVDWSRGLPKVRATEGFVQIDRTGAMDFSLARALPPKKDDEPPSGGAEVVAERIELRYRDLTKAPALNEKILVQNARVAVADGAGQVRTDLALRYGPIEAEAEWNTAGEWSGEATWPSQEQEYLWPHARRWIPSEILTQLRGLQSSGLRTGGDFQIQGSPKGVGYWQSTLEVDGKGVGFPGWARRADLRGPVGLTPTLATLDLRARDGGLNASFVGILDWSQTFLAEGRIQAEARSTRDLPPFLSKALPPELKAQGNRFSGTLLFRDGRYEVGGKLDARQLSYGDVSGQRLAGQVRFTDQGFVLAGVKGQYDRVPVTGGFSYRYRGGQLSGFARTASSVDLARFGKQLGYSDLRGSARLEAVVGGTAKRPQGAFRAEGRLGVDRIDFDRFQASARLDGDRLTIDRFQGTGREGDLLAVGKIDLGRQTLDIGLQAEDLDLGVWADGVEGAGDVSGRLMGGFRSLAFQGRGISVGPKYGDYQADFLSTGIDWRGDTLRLSDLRARANRGVLGGELALDLSSQVLSGKLTEATLPIHEIRPDSPVVGIFTLESSRLSGTLEAPIFEATFTSPAFALRDLAVSDARIQVKADREKLTLSSAELSFDEGLAELSGEYIWKDRTGEASFRLEDAGLAALKLPSQVGQPGGRISGEGQVKFDDKGLTYAEIELEPEQIVIGETTFGSGVVLARFEDRVWTGSAEIGSLGGFFIGRGLRYELDTQKIGGRVETFGLALESFASSSLIRQLDLDEETQNLIAGVQGELKSAFELGGDIKKPTVIADLIQIDRFRLADQELGQIKARGSFETTSWDLVSFDWRFPGGALLAKAKQNEVGGLSGDVRLENLDLRALSRINPAWPSLPATGGADLVLSGTVDNPVVRGTTNPILFGDDPDNPLAVIRVDDILYQNKKLEATGLFTAMGFQGTLRADVPLSSLLESTAQTPLYTVTATLEDSELADLFVSPQSGQERLITGRLTGSISATGTQGDFRLGGRMSLRDGKVASSGVTTGLEGITGDLTLDGDRARLLVDGRGTLGGEVQGDLTVDLAEYLGTEFSLPTWLSQSGVRGSVLVTGFAFAENEKDPNRRIVGQVDLARAEIRGSLAQPRISGGVQLSGVSAALPSGESEPTTFEGLINPIFENIAITHQGPAYVSNPSLNLALNGQGLLSGDLKAPRLEAGLAVESGTFSLPSAKIRLEEGGRMNFRYDGARQFQDQARLDLDLRGTTQVTALKNGQTPDRYDIDLEITGNLLQEGGLNLNATSDPPDLSRDEILALLGQTGLIQDLARGVTANDQDALRNTAYQLAVPNLTQGLTQSVASAFKIDFLGIDYNVFEGATFTASDTIARGLTVTVRRQLIAEPDRRALQEFLLTWRVPSRDPFLSRLRLGIGVTQDVPWKISLGYSQRLGLRLRESRPIRLYGTPER